MVLKKRCHVKIPSPILIALLPLANLAEVGSAGIGGWASAIKIGESLKSFLLHHRAARALLLPVGFGVVRWSVAFGLLSFFRVDEKGVWIMDEMALGLRDTLGRSTRHLQMISENLANSATPGFRAGEVMTEPVLPFDRMLEGKIAAHRERDATDLTQGALRQTDRPLDFALNGDGFFVVAHGDKEYLTRNGSFEVDQEGYLRTSAGYQVLDSAGEPLRIPANVRLQDVHAAEDGSLLADGRMFGRFRLERVDHETDLVRVGTTLFSADPARREQAETTTVLGRMLESSNTVVFQELSNLILLNRSVEALQRAQGNEMQAQRKMMDALSG